MELYAKQSKAAEVRESRKLSGSPKSPYSRLKCLSRSPIRNTDDNRLL